MADTFTAEEYRIAAKVARAGGWRFASQSWEDQADQLDAAEDYARQLALSFDYRLEPMSAGTVIIRKLLDDGWTAPEGLI